MLNIKKNNESYIIYLFAYLILITKSYHTYTFMIGIYNIVLVVTVYK